MGFNEPMTLLVGQLGSADGASMNAHLDDRLELRYSAHTCRADSYRPTQPAVIPVDVEHRGAPVGEVLYLCQRGLGLYAVIEVDDDVIDLLPDPVYLSGELEGLWNEHTASYRDVELRAVALVARSATVGKDRARIVTGSIDDAHLYWANSTDRALLEEARDYHRARRGKLNERHHISAIPMNQRNVERLDNGLTLLDGEPIPISGIGPIEYRVGRIIAVGGRPVNQ